MHGLLGFSPVHVTFTLNIVHVLVEWFQVSFFLRFSVLCQENFVIFANSALYCGDIFCFTDLKRFTITPPVTLPLILVAMPPTQHQIHQVCLHSNCARNLIVSIYFFFCSLSCTCKWLFYQMEWFVAYCSNSWQISCEKSVNRHNASLVYLMVAACLIILDFIGHVLQGTFLLQVQYSHWFHKFRLHYIRIWFGL